MSFAPRSLHELARALGGEISGQQVVARGPGHSPKDRSLSVRISPDAPDGFIVHSFSGDDAIACKDYVRSRLGLAPFKRNGGGKDKLNGDARTAKSKPVRTIEFDYRDPEIGEPRYRKTRREYADGSKDFIINPKGRGGSAPLLYGAECLADLGEGQPVFVVEGENKIDRLRQLGAIAVSGDTGRASKWLPAHAELLRGLRVILWPDSDAPGEKYIAAAAEAIRAVEPGANILVVRPFGAPDGAKGMDVCNWTGDPGTLAELAACARPYAPLPIGNGETGRFSASPESAKAPAPFARIINPADWEGVGVPEREWIVPDYIPHRTVTLLSGDGGQGKSLLALQLAAARALARDWIGLLPEHGRTLVLSAEDDGDEMHRRLDRIRDALAVAVQWDREPGGLSHVIRVDVKFDLDTVRKVVARFVDHYVPGRHQEQAFVALEEKAARIRQQPLLLEGADACRGEQKGFDHRCRANLTLCPLITPVRNNQLGSKYRSASPS